LTSESSAPGNHEGFPTGVLESIEWVEPLTPDLGSKAFPKSAYITLCQNKNDRRSKKLRTRRASPSLSVAVSASIPSMSAPHARDSDYPEDDIEELFKVERQRYDPIRETYVKYTVWETKKI
jgi:hypothetical protein